jgi:hypothetical protein
MVYSGESYREGNRAGLGHTIDAVVIEHVSEHPQQAVGQQDPAYRVVGTP